MGSRSESFDKNDHEDKIPLHANRWFHHKSHMSATDPVYCGPGLSDLFSIPYLFDLAYCEDLYGTPFSQPSLIDSEKVEPFGEEASSSSMDPALTERGPFSPSLSRFVLSSFFQARHCRLGAPILLTSVPRPRHSLYWFVTNLLRRPMRNRARPPLLITAD